MVRATTKNYFPAIKRWVPVPFPDIFELHEETNIASPEPLIESVDIDDCYPPTPVALYHSLLTSDSLFFIRYTLEGTLKSRWFLVQINHDETNEFNMNPQTTEDYHVTLLSRYTSDNHLCDDNFRLWSLWYKNVLDKNNIPIYGLCI